MKKKGMIINVSSMLGGMMAGMLIAPKKGKELRSDIKEKAKDIKNKGMKNSLKSELKKLEKEVNDLTNEKVKPVLKEKTDMIMQKLENLIEKAKVKKDKMIEKSANNLKNKVTEMIPGGD